MRQCTILFSLLLGEILKEERRSMSTPSLPVEVFCSFAEADAQLLEQLERHLSVLQHEKVITIWNKRQVVVGSDWKVEVDQHLNTASIILLLISPSFLASGYQYGIELQRAIERHNAREARVIPILLRPCDWRHALFGKLQVVPRNEKAVTIWHNQDEAFTEIAKEIRATLVDVQQFPDKFPPIVPATWNVPYRRNPHFTGRDEVLELLTHQLSPEIPENLTTPRQPARTVLKGLGGIGKTQIAVEYAYRARNLDQYTYTFWINAASEEVLITSFVTIAEFLPSFPAKNETDQSKLVEAIKGWLEQCPQSWLLIFDNADDVLVDDYLPQWGNGSILLTTRAHAVGLFSNFIEVETMSFLEGAHLLLRRAHRFGQASDDDINQAIDVAIALDHLPLALDQAGAYIDETGCSLVGYLDVYRTRHSTLLEQRGSARDYPNSVATTWSLSFQKVQQANPAAAELLHLCAFLAPDKIPEELVIRGALYWPTMLEQAADSHVFNEMIKELLKFSLIKRLANDRLLSVHRLVQTIQRDMLVSEIQYQWAERVVRGVNAVFPKNPNTVVTWPECRLYLDQVQACSVLIEEYKLLLTEGAEVLNRAGLYLDKHALRTLAKPLLKRAMDMRAQITQGARAAEALSQTNMAEYHRGQGEYAEAEPLYLSALAIFEQVAPLDTDTASCLNNLALLYFAQEKYAEAEPFYRRALPIFEQNLGETHPDTASCINNLANLYYSQGNYEEAEPFYKRALAAWELQGNKHPDMAISVNNLAELYRSQERYKEAEPLYQQALEISKLSFKETHPIIALILNNIALLYHSQGKYEEAEPFLEQALKLFELSLGDLHPNAADTLSNLANLYYTQGKYEKAEPLLKRAIVSYEHIWGVKHSYTLTLRRVYVSLLRKLGRDEEAEEIENSS
jgi:tetratricopeptide (TPR) repeat protein